MTYPTEASPGDPALDVTAVICTYTEARWALLCDAIDSLRRQTLTPEEILVVVDYNPVMHARLQREFPDLRVVENRHTKGLSGAKNTALEEAKGSIIAILDDDAVADERWLETLTSHFSSRDVIAAGSAAIPQWEVERPQWFPPELDWTVGCSYRGLPETPSPVRNVFGGAMAVRRDAARKLGGFDHQLGRVGNRHGGAEETEFCIRLSASAPNSCIVYDPSTHVHHHVPKARASWSYVWRRCYGEGLSKATLSRLAKTRNALHTERNYVIRTIPSGVWREVRRARVDAAAALVAAVATTATGYVIGKVRVAAGADA